MKVILLKDVKKLGKKVKSLRRLKAMAATISFLGALPRKQRPVT